MDMHPTDRVRGWIEIRLQNEEERFGFRRAPAMVGRRDRMSMHRTAMAHIRLLSTVKIRSQSDNAVTHCELKCELQHMILMVAAAQAPWMAETHSCLACCTPLDDQRKEA